MAGAIERMIALTQDEDEQLRQRAHELGVSEEAFIREAVRHALAGHTSRGNPADDREAARVEWEQVMALMRARSAISVPPADRTKGRGWTREEIYDERFDRLPR